MSYNNFSTSKIKLKLVAGRRLMSSSGHWASAEYDHWELKVFHSPLYVCSASY